MNVRLALLAMLAATFAAAPARGQDSAPPTPEAAVEQLLTGLEAAAEAHGDEPVEVRFDALLPVVTATHDLPYIAELTIRREWPALTEAQRQRFVDAFVRLSVMTYASRFGSLKEGMFVLGESEPPSGDRAVVTA